MRLLNGGLRTAFAIGIYFMQRGEMHERKGNTR